MHVIEAMQACVKDRTLACRNVFKERGGLRWLDHENGGVFAAWTYVGAPDQWEKPPGKNGWVRLIGIESIIDPFGNPVRWKTLPVSDVEAGK